MRIGTTVLATLLLLGACTSEASSPKQPTDSPTSSGSATPTATAPTMPEQATEDSPEGAAAFVKHWVDVFNYAAQTGDVAELERLSSPDCTGCQKLHHALPRHLRRRRLLQRRRVDDWPACHEDPWKSRLRNYRCEHRRRTF
ncbi:DUF6318 family protein [Aeromicrobium sp. UC242_57]|uniref:DUF6318 family protein n=1 Tax=Aeromicrobium sp. UC242_57 TaxID=3374624 RepID=UPI00378E09A3